MRSYIRNKPSSQQILNESTHKIGKHLNYCFLGRSLLRSFKRGLISIFGFHNVRKATKQAKPNSHILP